MVLTARIIASLACLVASAAGLALAGLALAGPALSEPALGAEIWFGLPQPRPDVLARLHADPTRNPAFMAALERAQTDWDHLFAPGVLDSLAPPMQVAQIGTGFVLSMPENELAKLAALVDRHVAIDFVAQPVINEDPHCGNTEGYERPAALAAALDKLRRLALPIRTLSLDEGLFFGHYATGEGECRLSLKDTIRQVALTINAFRAQYPDIVVGEIEPTVPITRAPDWQEAMRAYRDGLAAATGKTLAFFELDIAWQTPQWQQSVVAETVVVHQMGTRMGYIYNGEGNDHSDAAWLAHAARNIAEIEGGLGLNPDHVSFGSWNPHPSHILATPPQGTLAGLMLDYMRPGTRLKLAPSATTLGGELTDLTGHPLSGYHMTLQAVAAVAGAAKTPVLPEQQLSGSVPSGAHTGIVALRINAECLCAGLNELKLGDISYQETAGGTVRQITSFLPELRHAMLAGGPEAPTVRIEPEGSGEIAAIRALPNQTLLLNGKPFAVTPGAHYTLNAAVRNHLGTDVFGGVAMIWLDGPPGLGRETMTVRAIYQDVGTAVSDANGHFAFPRPLDSEHQPAPLRLTVPDQQGHRAAISELMP